MSQDVDDFADLEAGLRSAFGDVRRQGAGPIDLEAVRARVVRTRRRQRAMVVGTAAASVAVVVAGALGFGALRDKASPQPVVPATSTSARPSPVSSTPAPVFAGGALVPGLAPANRAFFSQVTRREAPKVTSDPQVLLGLDTLCNSQGGPTPLGRLSDIWQDVDGVETAAFEVLRLADESQAQQTLASCATLLNATPAPEDRDVLVRTGASEPLEGSTYLATVHGAYVIVLRHVGTAQAALPVLQAAVARVAGRAPLTSAAELAPPPPLTHTKTGIPYSVADGIPGRDDEFSLQVTGERQAWVMNLQTCDPVTVGRLDGQVIGGIDGYSIGSPATATIIRVPAGQGPTAWQQLVSNTSVCRWVGPARLSSWAGHPQGRMVDDGTARAATQQVGDFIVSVSQIADGSVDPAQLQRLNDEVVTQLRDAGLVE